MSTDTNQSDPRPDQWEALGNERILLIFDWEIFEDARPSELSKRRMQRKELNDYLLGKCKLINECWLVIDGCYEFACPNIDAFIADLETRLHGKDGGVLYIQRNGQVMKRYFGA